MSVSNFETRLLEYGPNYGDNRNLNNKQLSNNRKIQTPIFKDL